MFDLDKIGADWDFAINHGTACKPGKPIQQRQISSSVSINAKNVHSKRNFCLCCLNIVNKEPIPLCENSKQLQFLGFGFPLYFIFIKYIIILLLLQIFAYSMLSLRWALNSTYDICQQAAVRELPKHYQGVFRYYVFLYIQQVWLICEIPFERQINIMTKESALYQIIRLSYQIYPNKQGLKRRLEILFDQGSRIILLKFRSLFLQINQKIFIVSKKKNRKLFEVQNQHNRERQMIEKDEVKCEKVIVVLQNEYAKFLFLKLFSTIQQDRLKQFFGQGSQNIDVKEAPQPKQIIWENINIPQNKRMLRLFLGWGLTALFIAAITGIFYGILYGKGHAVEQALTRIKANPDDPGAAAQQRQALAATIITMLLIIFFNKFCLSFVLHIFTNIQKHRTGSEFQFSFGLKYTLGLFFTTAIMTIIVEISVFHNVYSEKYGVVEEESIMFFLNSFLVPIILLINPWYIFKLIKRWYYKNRPELTQRQANNLMQDPQYTMGKPYAQIIQSVWFTYLYSSIIPGGTILILLGFAFYYWVDKFTLLKRSIINQNVNGDLCMWAMKLIDASLLLRAVGEFVFDSQIRDSTTYESIICICIGAVYLALPMNKVLQFFHNQKFKIEEKSYLQAKSRFIQNYHTMHPLYTQQKYVLGSKSKILGASKNFMAIYAPSIEENRSQNQLLEINLFKKKSFA